MRGALIVLVLLEAGLSGAALAQERVVVEVVRRVIPTETVAGVVGIRDAFEVELEVPARCDDGAITCRERRRFPRVYRLEFELEKSILADGRVERSREGRGVIHFALHFDADQEREFEERLGEIVSGLSAAAFRQSFAGTQQYFGSTALSADSVEPSFACFEEDSGRRVTMYARIMKRNPEGAEYVAGLGTTGIGDEDQNALLCAGLAEATDPVAPRDIRTFGLPRAFDDIRVTLQWESDLGDELYVDELTPLPPDVIFTRAPTPPGVGSFQSNSLDLENGAYTSETGRDGTVDKVGTVPADLPPLAVRSDRWIGRWTLTRERVALGASPASELISSESLLTALLPTLPPARLDAEGSPLDDEELGAGSVVGVAADIAALVADVAARLDDESDLSPEVIESIVTERPAGLGGPAWILIACRDDTDARYWLPPSPAFSPLTNADLFCAEARRQIGDAAP